MRFVQNTDDLHDRMAEFQLGFPTLTIHTNMHCLPQRFPNQLPVPMVPENKKIRSFIRRLSPLSPIIN